MPTERPNPAAEESCSPTTSAAPSTSPASSPEGLTRRSLLGWSLGAVPLGLWAWQAQAQGFAQAPLMPRDAAANPEHSFWKDLRNEFPIEPGHIHFDSAGIGTPPFQVLEAMQTADRQAAGTGSGRSADWGDALRLRLQGFLNAPDDTLLLASSDTSAMNRVADALPLSRGTRVLLATHEMPSAMSPWVSLAREGRVDVRMVELSDDPRTNVNRVRGQFDTGTVLVVPHVLPTTGAVLPLEDLREIVHKRRGMIIVQGSQALGMQAIDLQALGVDAYVASTSTWLGGPPGVAFAYVRPGMLPSLTARPALLDVRTPQYVVQRRLEVKRLQDLETDTLNPGLASGTTVALDWMAAFGVEAARSYATSLSQELHAGLTKLSGIEVLSTEREAQAMPIVAFRVTRRPNTQVADWLLRELGMRVHRLDNDNINAVRVSTSIRNEMGEVRWLVRAAEALA